LTCKEHHKQEVRKVKKAKLMRCICPVKWVKQGAADALHRSHTHNTNYTVTTEQCHDYTMTYEHLTIHVGYKLTTT